MTDQDNARWRKSSRSSGGANNCVELPHTLDAVRDSKNGEILPLAHNSVAALLAAVRHDRIMH